MITNQEDTKKLANISSICLQKIEKDKQMTKIAYIYLVRDAIAADSVRQFTDSQLFSFRVISSGLLALVEKEFARRVKVAEKNNDTTLPAG